ncbi:MAG: phosphonate metabolism protein/1,5-bisphosphokinase (PRPP-forming) PhnN [Gammaproteobacteria bacterium]|nr:phosphonate metabolism protein/1,5-bisphosphokinase (PRPP-forming) PhnN [Gammaproteobacteria bacterium]MCP5458506.1 phosphonate metabolism protein/1,5-bisphosphokinase (PRPP-forming) PhnN [Gammaproteobacteria bacterium]
MNHTKRPLFYLMGASGAGKDSLIAYARQRLDGLSSTVFAHRYITRPPSAEGENHIYLSPAEFEQRWRVGCFAMHWDSHGYRYGIGIEIDCWLDLGLTVLVSGSRGHLPQARQRYPDLRAVLVKVSPERLGERLRRRGRESADEIAERMRRAGAFGESLREVPDLIILDNDGPLEEAGTCLLKLLRD